jgi:hypothetical protein
MSTAPNLAKGRSLGETLEQVLPREIIQEHQLARAAWLNAGRPGEAFDPSDKEQEGILERFREAQEALDRHAIKVLSEGGVSVWAAQNGSGTLSEIPSLVWSMSDTQLTIDQLAAKNTKYRASVSSGPLRELRTFPILHLPDVAERMAPLSFAEAFKRFVLQDAELVTAVRQAASEGTPCLTVLEGRFTEASPLWPAVLDEYDLAVEWADSIAQRMAKLHPKDKAGAAWLDDPIPESAKRAAAILRDRFNRFIFPLRRGAVIACGHQLFGLPTAVLPSLWSSSRVRIDPVNGDLFDEHAGLSWRGIFLERPSTSNLMSPHEAAEPKAQPHQAVAPEVEHKHLGGRPPKYHYNLVVPTVMNWLAESGLPDTKRGLAKLWHQAFEKKFPDDPDQVPDLDTIRKYLIAHQTDTLNAIRDQ